MRACLELNPIVRIGKINKTIYDLSFVQEPRYARESTVLKNQTSSQSTNIHKRLLHPFPIIGLKIYYDDQKLGRLDITSHNLSFFFLKATIIDEDSQHGGRKGINTDSVIVGTKLISGIFYNLPRDQLKLDDRAETMIIFMFTDIGFLKKGNYKISFELYKFEPFNYLVPNQLSKLTKITELYSKNIKVYGPREYYKPSVQETISNEMKLESEKIINNRLRSKVVHYLKAINIIKDYDRNTNSNNSSKDGSAANNKSTNARKPKTANNGGAITTSNTITAAAAASSSSFSSAAAAALPNTAGNNIPPPGETKSYAPGPGSTFTFTVNTGSKRKAEPAKSNTGKNHHVHIQSSENDFYAYAINNKPKRKKKSATIAEVASSTGIKDTNNNTGYISNGNYTGTTDGPPIMTFKSIKLPSLNEAINQGIKSESDDKHNILPPLESSELPTNPGINNDGNIFVGSLPYIGGPKSEDLVQPLPNYKITSDHPAHILSMLASCGNNSDKNNGSTNISRPPSSSSSPSSPIPSIIMENTRTHQNRAKPENISQEASHNHNTVRAPNLSWVSSTASSSSPSSLSSTTATASTTNDMRGASGSDGNNGHLPNNFRNIAYTLMSLRQSKPTSASPTSIIGSDNGPSSNINIKEQKYEAVPFEMLTTAVVSKGKTAKKQTRRKK
ncbi:hypothetical protein DASC09_035190 [Saccharomycopsis crataegensis]|uniref:Velvet domain-containing protein n=1 Tax=Saccharomycopsis crataegensis TaxID=43959 RepID=A0AAV5QP15_9ASCO|nr:hypothetical protein DASC09_035190 [Saccharomycopsis crataegensis]